MTSIENDALISQINNKTKLSWEQSRLIASAIGRGGIEFPWDEEKDIETESKIETTQQDLKESYQRYLDHINAVK